MREIENSELRIKNGGSRFKIVGFVLWFFALSLTLPSLAQEKKQEQQEVEKLLKQLNDDEWKVREEATRKLIELWEDDAVKKCVEETLKKAKEEVKTQGLSGNEMTERCERILERIGFRRVLGKGLVKQLGAEKVEELFGADEQTALGYFEEWLKDAKSRKKYGLEDERRQGALSEWLVGRLESQKAKEQFIRFVQNQGQDLKEAAKGVVRLLKDEDADVRGYAVLALGKIGAKEYVKPVAELLKDGDAWVRGDAAQVLGNMGAKEYAREVAELLKDGNAGVRGAAAKALGNMGAKEYAREVAELLKDESSGVRINAAQALKNWGYKLKRVGKVVEEKWELEEKIKEQK